MFFESDIVLNRYIIDKAYNEKGALEKILRSLCEANESRSVYYMILYHYINYLE